MSTSQGRWLDRENGICFWARLVKFFCSEPSPLHLSSPVDSWRKDLDSVCSFLFSQIWDPSFGSKLPIATRWSQLASQALLDACLPYPWQLTSLSVPEPTTVTLVKIAFLVFWFWKPPLKWEIHQACVRAFCFRQPGETKTCWNLFGDPPVHRTGMYIIIVIDSIGPLTYHYRFFNRDHRGHFHPAIT